MIRANPRNMFQLAQGMLICWIYVQVLPTSSPDNDGLGIPTRRNTLVGNVRKLVAVRRQVVFPKLATHVKLLDLRCINGVPLIRVYDKKDVTDVGLRVPPTYTTKQKKEPPLEFLQVSKCQKDSTSQYHVSHGAWTKMAKSAFLQRCSETCLNVVREVPSLDFFEEFFFGELREVGQVISSTHVDELVRSLFLQGQQELEFCVSGRIVRACPLG
jgi:hypothetical protein